MRLTTMIRGLCLAAVAALAMPFAAQAQVGPYTYSPNVRFVAMDVNSATYNNSTTGYTDVTGVSVALPATTAPFANQLLRVCYSADVTKATSTTGTIAVYANGAVIAASARTVGVGQWTMAACYIVARADGAAQTIKLQAKSGDTAQFTVTNVQMEVWRIDTLNS